MEKVTSARAHARRTAALELKSRRWSWKTKTDEMQAEVPIRKEAQAGPLPYRRLPVRMPARTLGRERHPSRLRCISCVGCTPAYEGHDTSSQRGLPVRPRTERGLTTDFPPVRTARREKGARPDPERWTERGPRPWPDWPFHFSPRRKNPRSQTDAACVPSGRPLNPRSGLQPES